MKSRVIKNLFAYLALATSCSDKYQSLYDASPSPMISFNKDTIQIRERDYLNINQTDNGMLVIQSLSPNHQMNLQLNDVSDKVHFEYKGEQIPNAQAILISGDSINLYCNCDTPGIYPARFTIQNQLGKPNSRDLIIYCLKNQPAKALFTITAKDSITENYNYQFDATQCIKPDGIIMEYHYNINGIPFSTNTPILNWVFHARGLQSISLFVIDDLQIHSDTLTKTFLIP